MVTSPKDIILSKMQYNSNSNNNRPRPVFSQSGTSDGSGNISVSAGGPTLSQSAIDHLDSLNINLERSDIPESILQANAQINNDPYKPRDADATHGSDGPEIKENEGGYGWGPKNSTQSTTQTSIHENKSNEGKTWITPGGGKTTINLDIPLNQRAGTIIDYMQMQKDNLTGISTKTQGLDFRTGEILEPNRKPGVKKFTIQNYINPKATPSIQWTNIGKNTDVQQHQAALDLQSKRKFENHLQSQFATLMRGGSLNQKTFNAVFNQIDKSQLSRKDKDRIKEEFTEKKINYQKAIGGFGYANPWKKTSVPKKVGPNNKTQKLGSGTTWDKLIDPNTSF